MIGYDRTSERSRRDLSNATPSGRIILSSFRNLSTRSFQCQYQAKAMILYCRVWESSGRDISIAITKRRCYIVEFQKALDDIFPMLTPSDDMDMDMILKNFGELSMISFQCHHPNRSMISNDTVSEKLSTRYFQRPCRH